MDVRHLRYFVAVAEKLHFGEAARQLNMTQPPLSKRISELEEGLGVLLFARTSRKVVLTPSGQALLPKARASIKAFEDALTTVSKKAPRSRRVRAGFPSDTSRHVLGSFLAALRSNAADPTLHEGSTAEHHSALLAGELDVAVLRRPYNTRGLWSSPPLWQTLGVVLAGTHPLARLKEISLRELSGYTLALFPRALSPGLYDDLLAQCRAEGYLPQRIEHVVRMTVGLLAQESAVTFRPAAGMRAAGNRRKGSELTWRPLKGEPLRWSTSVVCRRDDPGRMTRLAVRAIEQALEEHDGWTRFSGPDARDANGNRARR
jgi:DNA-binding transcriptional LysR family regulator